MQEAVKPALDRMTDLMPVRTGALKATARTKIVRDKPYEIKALVGSKKKVIGHYIKTRKILWNAGNMAHLQEYGPITGKRKWKFTPFARPAESQTAGLVQNRLQSGLDTQLKQDFNTES